MVCVWENDPKSQSSSIDSLDAGRAMSPLSLPHCPAELLRVLVWTHLSDGPVSSSDPLTTPGSI